MPIHVALIILAGWIAWAVPFFQVRRDRKRQSAPDGAPDSAATSSDAAPTIDRRARWGILLVFFAYLIIWQPRYRVLQPGIGRMAGAVLAFAGAVWLSWSSARTLGRQWRIDAGLNAGHELVRTGAYRLVRHPIYLSMFGTLLGTGLLLTPWRLLPAAVLLFIAGTEIRVRVEDRLLAARFGAEFEEYRRRVPAHLPFVHRR